MRQRAWNRVLACALDWVSILGWVVVLAAIGIPLHLTGVTDQVGPLIGNLIGAVLLVLPVTIVFARLESGRRQATVGKRVRGVRVENAAGGAVSFRSALTRNALKIALPWSLGHAAVYGLARGDNGAGVILATALAYALPIAYVVSLFIGDGRTPYDRLARTTVTGR